MTITVARQAPALPVGLKLLVVLLLAAGLAGWLEPRLLREPVGFAGDLLRRVKLDLSTTEIPDLRGEVMAFARAADGAVWVVGQQDVVRFAEGTVAEGRRLLDPAIFRGLFRRPMDPLSAVHVTSTGEAWVGSRYGQVLRYRAGGWTLVSDGEAFPIGRVSAILAAEGVTYVGGQGLWRTASAEQGLRELEDFPRHPVTALARGAAGELVVGSRDGVRARRDGFWEILWRTSRDDQEVSGLFLTRDGHMLVATHDGYVVLDARGRVLYRELPGRRVTGFTELPDGELWVTTWASGVHVRVRGAWRRVGSDQGLAGDGLSAVLADGRRRLWLGLHGEGGGVIDATLLKTFAAEETPVSPLPGAVAFPDACAAAASRLGGRGASGGVAVETVTGRPTVFFNDRQVCPPGAGHRRDAGTFVSVADNAVRLTLAGVPSLLPLPARAVGARPTAAFVDSRDRLWLGFRDRGVFLLTGGRWQAFGRAAGLERNPVQAIDEDAEGGIWIATRPLSGRDAAARGLAGVHRYDGRTWRHFHPASGPGPVDGGTRRGLAAPGASSVRVLPDGRIAVATDGGLSIHERGAFTTFVYARLGGLPSSFVADVVTGPDGRVWMTHSLWGHGVTWQSGFLFHNRSARDGLLFDRVARVAFDAENNVWMLSSYGELGIYPLASLTD